MGDDLETIGPFSIRGQLGRGAMAVVWRGYDPSLDREVAIKEPLLPGGMSAEAQEAFLERFLREARAAARLNHPGIVTVFSAAAYDERPVIVMELIGGPTLREVLRRHRLTPEQVGSMMEQLLEAVAYAHGHGIVHRDLKPENVFLTLDGRIKLADFGVAHVEGSGMLTTAGTILGTPAYMSPEQIKGHKTDARSDVFSLGLIAYEALVGRNPAGDSSTEITTIMYRLCHEPLPPIDASVSPLASSLAGVVLTAAEKEPGARFADAGEMLDAWSAASEGQSQSRTTLTGLAAALGEAPAAEDAGVLTTVLGMEQTVLETRADLGTEAEPPEPLAEETVVTEPEAEADETRDTLPLAPRSEEDAETRPKRKGRRRLLVTAAIVLGLAGIVFAASRANSPSTPQPVEQLDAALPTTGTVIETVATKTAEPVIEAAGTKLAVSVAPASLHNGERGAVSATLTGAMNRKGVGNARLVLQQSFDNRGWTSVQSVVARDGSAKFGVTVGRLTYFRVVFEGTAAWLAATSSSMRVSYVAPAPAPAPVTRTRRRPYNPGGSSGPVKPQKPADLP